MGLQTPSSSWLCACFLDRFPRGSCSPGSDKCSPVRTLRSLAPPTSSTTPTSKDLCRGEETQGCYFLRSWTFCWLLLFRDKLIVTHLILAFLFTEVLSLGLADATASSRLPCFAGCHRPDRSPRPGLTRSLPSLAPLSSRDDNTSLLEVSRRLWYY